MESLKSKMETEFLETMTSQNRNKRRFLWRKNQLRF
jgi:hypothetical protein